MNKKIVTLIVCALISAVLFPVSAFALTDGAYSFEPTDDGNCKITYYDPTTGGLAPDIPSTLSSGGVDYTVTEIGNSAFMFSEIYSVTIPDTVILIDDYAFASNELFSVTIPLK